MKKIRFYALILSLSLMAIWSCSKKSDPAPSNTQLLTQNTWILSSFTSTDATTQSASVILIGTQWLFKTDKTFTITVTISGISGSSGGTWSFSSDEKMISITSGTSSGSLTIVTLNSTNLDLSEVAGTITNTYKFVKK